MTTSRHASEHNNPLANDTMRRHDKCTTYHFITAHEQSLGELKLVALGKERAERGNDSISLQHHLKGREV